MEVTKLTAAPHCPPQYCKYLFTRIRKMLSLYVLLTFVQVYVFSYSTFLLFEFSLIISPATIFPPPPPPSAQTREHTHTNFIQSTHINQLNEDSTNLFSCGPPKYAGTTSEIVPMKLENR